VFGEPGDGAVAEVGGVDGAARLIREDKAAGAVERVYPLRIL
jgi:hypothetical protein